MHWLFMGVVGAIAAVVVNTLLTSRRTRQALEEEAADAAIPGPKKTIPQTWGWAKVHLKAGGLKALGYYYRDRSAGPSFKVLVDLLESPTDDTIRAVAAEKEYIANSTFRLGAHETLYAGAREGAMAVLTEASYEQGEGAAGPDCAVVMMLTDAEKRAYELPEAMPGIEVYLS
jgi:hypothetical protein